MLKISTKDDAINAIPNADFDPEILVVCLLGGHSFPEDGGDVSTQHQKLLSGRSVTRKKLPNQLKCSVDFIKCR